MALSSTLANMLTIIRNGGRAGHESVDIPASNMARAIADILKQENYIENFRFSEDKKQGVLRIYLRYLKTKEPVICGLKIISKPGLRVYVDKKSIPYVLRGRGTAIISTSQGVVTDRKARELKVGGEVLCYIW